MDEEKKVIVIESNPPETIEPYKIEISVEDTGPDLRFYDPEVLPKWLRELVQE